jgi:hypothetical protein
MSLFGCVSNHLLLVPAVQADRPLDASACDVRGRDGIFAPSTRLVWVTDIPIVRRDALPKGFHNLYQHV